MMIDRRELIVGTAVVAVAPTLNPLLSLLASDEGLRPIKFMIEGWTFQDGSETDNVVGMSIGRSWRTSWR